MDTIRVSKPLFRIAWKANSVEFPLPISRYVCGFSVAMKPYNAYASNPGKISVIPKWLDIVVWLIYGDFRKIRLELCEIFQAVGIPVSPVRENYLRPGTRTLSRRSKRECPRIEVIECNILK